MRLIRRLENLPKERKATYTVHDVYSEIRFSKFDPSSSEEQWAALGEQLQICDIYSRELTGY